MQFVRCFPDEKTLFVNFKYISTPLEYETNSSGAKHMQAQVPVVKRRSPVSLKVFSSADQTLLFEKEFMPRGLRQDIAMFIYTQLVLDVESVDVELRETEVPNKVYRLGNVRLTPGDGTFVVMKDGQLQTTEKK